MTSVTQTTTKKQAPQEQTTVLREERKDVDGNVYPWDTTLSSSVHVHNPSIAKLKLWHGTDPKSEYYSLQLSNSVGSNSVIIFFTLEELKALETLLSNA